MFNFPSVFETKLRFPIRESKYLFNFVVILNWYILCETLSKILRAPQVNHFPGIADPTHIHWAPHDPLHMWVYRLRLWIFRHVDEFKDFSLSLSICHKTLDSIFNSRPKCLNARTLWWFFEKKKKSGHLGSSPSPPGCDWFITILVFLGRLAGGVPLWHFASFLAIFKQFNLILLVLAKLKQLGRKKKRKKILPTVFRLCSRNLLSVCIEVIKSANSYYTQSEKQVTYLYIL